MNQLGSLWRLSMKYCDRTGSAVPIDSTVSRWAIATWTPPSPKLIRGMLHSASTSSETAPANRIVSRDLLGDLPSAPGLEASGPGSSAASVECIIPVPYPRCRQFAENHRMRGKLNPAGKDCLLTFRTATNSHSLSGQPGSGDYLQ